MIPHALDFDSNPDIPPEATFWVPDLDEDIGDEGFGFFQDTWPIFDTDAAEAAQQVDIEAHVVTVLGGLAKDPADFERLASMFENDDLPTFDGALLDVWERSRDDVGTPLGGLEIGVAGLVLTLSAFGCYPAASCRGHATARPWSPYPVVYVALDLIQAEALRPHVARSGCGFGVDPERPELLTIVAPSILHSTALAGELTSVMPP